MESRLYRLLCKRATRWRMGRGSLRDASRSVSGPERTRAWSLTSRAGWTDQTMPGACPIRANGRTEANLMVNSVIVGPDLAWTRIDAQSAQGVRS
jgi:hypothetical protein